MKRLLLATLLCLFCLASIVEARSPRRPGRGSAEQDEDGVVVTAPAPTAAVTPQVTQPGQPAPQPAQPPQTGGPNPAAPGGAAPQIYVWKQGNVLHAVNNLSDVPPRYANQVESADKNPKMNRTIAEGEKSGATKPAKKGKRGGKGKPKRHAPDAPQSSAPPQPQSPATAKGATPGN
jgi:hypothetical protein